jgi:hypothetical protein
LVAVSSAGSAERAVRITTPHRSVTLPPSLLKLLSSRAATASFASGTGRPLKLSMSQLAALLLTYVADLT